MQNVKVTSDMNSFTIGSVNYNPVTGQFTNPRINWFYLLDVNNEQIRCFNDRESIQVTAFLNTVVMGRFGNNLNCFINVQNSNCENDECEYEVRDGIRQSGPNGGLPKKIFPNNFGINTISTYNLDFNIIGYLY